MHRNSLNPGGGGGGQQGTAAYQKSVQFSDQPQRPTSGGLPAEALLEAMLDQLTIEQNHARQQPTASMRQQRAPTAVGSAPGMPGANSNPLDQLLAHGQAMGPGHATLVISKRPPSTAGYPAHAEGHRLSINGGMNPQAPFHDPLNQPSSRFQSSPNYSSQPANIVPPHHQQQLSSGPANSPFPATNIPQQQRFPGGQGNFIPPGAVNMPYPQQAMGLPGGPMGMHAGMAMGPQGRGMGQPGVAVTAPGISMAPQGRGMGQPGVAMAANIHNGHGVGVPNPQRLSNAHMNAAPQAQRAIFLGGPGNPNSTGMSTPEEIPEEPLQIDSATQRYYLPQNKLEAQLRQEILNLRKNPRAYAQMLARDIRPYYQGTALRIPGQRGMATREGQAACDDAIRFLASIPPLTEDIQLSFGMSLAAKEACEECCPTGSTNYPSSVTKMEAYGYLEDEAVDLVGYGGRNMRDLVLFSFLVCDGDPTRARRTIMFDHRWKMMGVGAAHHNSHWGIMGVVNFAISYVPLLDCMKQSPTFINLVKVDLKDEARAMLEAIKQIQSVELGKPEEADWKARLREAALQVSRATEELVLTDKREEPLIKAVDVFKQLQAVTSQAEETEDARTRLREAAFEVGRATEQLVISNTHDKQFIRPVDILKELRASETDKARDQLDDALRSQLLESALAVGKTTNELVSTDQHRFNTIRPVDVLREMQPTPTEALHSNEDQVQLWNSAEKVGLATDRLFQSKPYGQ